MSVSARPIRTSTSQDLVLGNPGLLSDLQETPVRDIVDFLSEAGKRLRLDDNPFLQESFALALLTGGLAEPILRGVYDALPSMFERTCALELAERTIGSQYLDGWVASRCARLARARARHRHAATAYHGR